MTQWGHRQLLNAFILLYGDVIKMDKKFRSQTAV